MSGVLKLLVINQYYAPDIASTGQLAAELCSSLVRRGFDVHVITGQPSYERHSPTAPSFEILEGVHVHRVSLGGIKGRDRLAVRTLGYLRFLWGAWRKARQVIRAQKPDIILTFHNPPFVGLIGAHLAARYGLRYIYALYDIHPDVLLQMGWKLPRPLIRMWEMANSKIYQEAEAIIVLGEGMKRTLEEKGVSSDKVHVVYPWARPELLSATPVKSVAIRQELGIGPNDLLLLYAGNMGLLHPLDPIIDAASAVQGLPVHFLFVGDGLRRPHLLKRVKDGNLRQITFLPYQPLDKFASLVAAADASFVVLEPGLERLAVPSRAFTFLSAGSPIIALMSPQSDIARLIHETGCGWNPKDAQELRDLIHYLLKHPEEIQRRKIVARQVYTDRFRRDVSIAKYAEIMQGSTVYNRNIEVSRSSYMALRK